MTRLSSLEGGASRDQRRHQITVNGDAMELSPGATLAGLLDILGVSSAGTAVELCGTIVPARCYSQIQLENGHVVELVRFVGGG